MIHLREADQGSEEWMRARLGIPTASQFDRILTPKQRKYARGASTYRNELVAEWLLGHPLETGTSAWMERGVDLEDEARKWYEFTRDVDVESTGFILRDDEATGGSPDGLVGDDGGIEIKCPAAHTHVGYLLGEGDDHVGQIQGYMYLTGRQWWDLVVYCPGLPTHVERHERDEEYIEALDEALGKFLSDLNRAKDQLREHKKTSILDAVAEARASQNGPNTPTDSAVPNVDRPGQLPLGDEPTPTASAQEAGL